MTSASVRAAAGAVIVLALAGSLAAAARKPAGPPPRYLFAGVPWGVPADTAVARLTPRGYREVPKAGAADRVALHGRLFERDALATAFLDEQRRLLRWIVMISPGTEPFVYPAARKTYRDAVEEGTRRYGPPTHQVNHFQFPYEPGDGKQDWALRDGKATVRSQWLSKSGDRLTIEMDRTSAVLLTYESPEWQALEARRKVKRAADL